jgi:hypothetical protein
MTTAFYILCSVAVAYWFRQWWRGQAPGEGMPSCSWCGGKGYVPSWPAPRRCSCQFRSYGGSDSSN